MKASRALSFTTQTKYCWQWLDFRRTYVESEATMPGLSSDSSPLKSRFVKKLLQSDWRASGSRKPGCRWLWKRLLKKSTARELLSESLSGSSELTLRFVLEDSLHHIFTDKCRNAGLSGSQTPFFFFFLNRILNLLPSLPDRQGHGGRCLSVPVDTPNYSHSLELCFMPALAETLKVICNLLWAIDCPGVKLFPLCRTNILVQPSLIKSECECPA